MKLVKKLMLVFVLVLSLSFAACCPKDSDAAKSKMEDKGYNVVVDTKITPATLKLFGIENCVSSVICSKKSGDSVITVTAYYFEDSDSAKAAVSKVQEYSDKENKDDESGIKRAGNCIYFGSDEAVKDFK